MGGFMDRVVSLVRSVASLAKKAITGYVSWSRRKWGEGRAGKAQASVASLAIVLLVTRVLGGGDANELDPNSTIAPLSAPSGDEIATTGPVDEPEATERPTREPAPTQTPAPTSEPTDTPEPATVTPLPPTATTVPPTDVPPTEVVAPPTVPPPPPPPEAPTDCVDINSASLEDMRRIIHLDDVRAPDAIRLRPFRSVESLTRISGIGPARINEILEQGLACVR